MNIRGSMCACVLVWLGVGGEEFGSGERRYGVLEISVRVVLSTSRIFRSFSVAYV